MRRISIFGDDMDFRHEDYEIREAYQKGYKCGRKEAYKEIMEEQYGERNYGGSGNRGGNYGQRGGMNYRDWEDEDFGERRRRRSNGQFY